MMNNTIVLFPFGYGEMQKCDSAAGGVGFLVSARPTTRDFILSINTKPPATKIVDSVLLKRCDNLGYNDVMSKKYMQPVFLLEAM